ncbi:MAG: BCCT family transporter [Henriciella sp.]|nr:BCCT family transporter [Henriciella sp.]
MGTLRPFVLFVPMLLFCAAAIASLINLDGFFQFAEQLNDWILAQFSSLIIWSVFGFVLTCGAIAVSPFGKVKIGGPDAERLLTPWNWFSITLCTTIATGILFWAMAEPVFHLAEPGGRGIAPSSEAAQSFALVSLFMHWAISPYAIYTVAGLAFALSYHNLGKPYSVSGPFGVLIGRTVPKPISSLLDMSILMALVLGMAASLGAGMLMLSGGISNLAGIPNGPILLALVALAIGAVVLLSAITGLLKGIRVLSDINIKFFFAFAAFVFLFGPWQQILVQGGAAAVGYFTDFVPRSLFLGEAAADRIWAMDWTIFYFANWFAWAPVTAMFLGRIARGYSVRAFILVNLILPSIFGLLWMSIFGVFAMQVELGSGGTLSAVAQADGIEAIMFAALATLPLSELLVPILLFLAFISYVTAADSNTEAISQICNRQEAEVDDTRHQPVLKMTWIFLLATMAWIMVAFSGIDGVRMLSNVGGLPGMIVVIGLQLALIRMALQPAASGVVKTVPPAQPSALT